MSVECLFKMGNVPIYIDSNMEEDRILKGRKSNSDSCTYIIANPKTGNYICRI